MRISDWSSDVCSSDLHPDPCRRATAGPPPHTPTSVMPLDYVRGRRATDGDLPSGGKIGVAFDRAQRRRGGRVSCRRGPRKRARRPGARLHATERSEEHTSELQSLMRNSYAVFCLKKNKKKNTSTESREI